VGKGKGKGKSKETAEVDIDMAEVESEILAEEAIEIPDVPPAMIEAQKRRADLERLNTIDEPTRVEIGSMDVMGEFGSKVSLLLYSFGRTKLTYADQFPDQTSALVQDQRQVCSPCRFFKLVRQSVQ